MKINQKKHVTHHTTLVPLVLMPPRKNAAVADNQAGDDTRVKTRSTNVNKHPGKEAQDVLRVSKPRRDPEVIRKENDAKKAKKEAKTREKEEEKIRKEALDVELEQYRARQEVDMKEEIAKFPRHQPKSTSH